MFDPIARRFFDVGSQTRRISFQDDGVSRHRSIDTLRGYVVRDAEIFKDHARAELL
jgi:hypothetical protein